MPIKLQLATMFFALGLGAMPVQAQFVGDAKLLRLVAEKNKANLESLKTWQGQVKISNEFLNPNSKRSHKVSFSYDKSTQSYVFNSNQFGGGIRKPDGYYAVSGRNGRNNRKMLIRTKPGSIFGEFTCDFDAIIYLRVQQLDVHDRLMNFYNSRNNTGPFRITVTREKELVHFVCETGPLKTWYVFDLTQGGSPVEWGGSSPSINAKCTRRFEKVNGVWVPKHATAHSLYTESGAVLESNITWEKNIVNEPIPETEFQPERLGVRPGDMVTDRRTGKTYIFQGSKK